MESQKLEEKHTFLHKTFKRPYWDWFSESPVELVLLAFVLVFFFFMPRDNCGITPIDAEKQADPAAVLQE